MSSTEQTRALKARRITRACDYCHQRSIRCVRIAGSAQCQNCESFNQACTYLRKLKKRGVKSSRGSSLQALPSDFTLVPEQPYAVHVHTKRTWEAPAGATQAVIVDLIEIYFEIVYPIFPFFHKPTFIRRISRGDHLTDQNLFATTMAACALVSARVRDQAVFNTSWNLKELEEPHSEMFNEAAVAACATWSASDAQDINILRTHALLALTAIQCGKIREMQAHLGRYHTLVAMDGLHDESNWPSELGIVEIEERRRLYWSMYTLEIYSSIIWNGVTRVREQQVNVAYPAELDDELFSDRGYNQRAPSPVNIGLSPSGRWGEVGTSSWLCGWNFTTDLYRVMEHVITNFRDRKRHRRTFLTEMFGDQNTASESSVREGIMRLYSNLPQCFKECPEVTCDPASDRFGFQASNITATVQLLRMLLFASGGGSIEERCKIASEVVDAFSKIPAAYLRATSSPLVHHLAGIGAILGSVFEEPLSELAYQQVRAVLLALAQLLENLDHGIHSTVSAQRLWTLVARIDRYMHERNERVTMPFDANFEMSSPNATAKSHGTNNISSSNDNHGSFDGTTTRSVVASETSASLGGDAGHGQIIPAQLTTEFFEEWPWNLDFMQLSGGWSSLENIPI